MYTFLGELCLFLFKAFIAVAIGWGLHKYVSQYSSWRELFNDTFK